MKKILLTVFVLFLAQFVVQSSALADEIIDSKGNIIPCKIISVSDGLIEYKKDNCQFSFNRILKDPVFSDYVDVRRIVSGKLVLERISGYVSCKNLGGVIVKKEGEIIDIPWYWVANLGIYKPE
jgi:hypothetical protein